MVAVSVQSIGRRDYIRSELFVRRDVGIEALSVHSEPVLKNTLHLDSWSGRRIDREGSITSPICSTEVVLSKVGMSSQCAGFSHET